MNVIKDIITIHRLMIYFLIVSFFVIYATAFLIFHVNIKSLNYKLPHKTFH